MMRWIGIVFFLLIVPHAALAAPQEVEVIQEQINNHGAEIERLEAEISQYEQELTKTQAEKQTLQSAVRQIDISRQKISASVAVAQERIAQAHGDIQSLSGDIKEKQKEIASGKEALGEALRSLYAADSQTIAEILLRNEQLSDLWNETEFLSRFNGAMRTRVASLAAAKVAFESALDETEKKEKVLADQQKELSAQKYALDINKREKDQLLTRTKEEEAAYQELLAEKRAAKESFEAALLDLESQLVYALDPSKIPEAGKGVLRNPLDSVFITQYFGNTKFAQSGAYNGSGHNGIDFRAGVGTPVKASLTATVQATGNTDAQPGCYSYGKWVLLRHPNGLTTLYAHLSEIVVGKGQNVTTGEVIGFSGNTGYSTGPHLHFTVYESDAVQVVRLGDVKKRTNCANAYIPVAPLEAYLNPLDYL